MTGCLNEEPDRWPWQAVLTASLTDAWHFNKVLY